MTTASPTASPSASGHVTIVFTSDWGVSTGVGQAGRTHSTIERSGDDPVVRGTVITGVLREQAMLAAKALDGPTEENKKGKWTSFALWLFGQDPNSEPGSTPHPRHVLFSDATPASPIHIHDTVSLSIDPQTGTARDQFLRFTERAAAGVLTGTFTLIEEAGAEISDQRTIDAAHFLLGVAGLMVRGIGSGRSGGDGECMVAVSDKDYTKTDLRKEEAADALTRILANQDNGDSPTYSSADVKTVAGHLRNSVRESFQKVPDLPKDLSKNSPQDIAILNSQQSESGDTTWYATSLDIVLESPVVSYEVPFSNEVRSLDFLRGTVLVPWLHGLLRKNYRGNALVNSAIVSGDLRISDALPVYKELAGLPVPFVLENEKVHEDKQGDIQPCTLFNRHIPINDQVCGDHTIPTRGRYLFVKSSGTPVAGWIGKPSLIGRQSTAINSETGAAKDGQLFLVRALPAGLTLRASIVVSKQLLSELRGTDATPVASPLTLDLGIAEQPAFLGSRKLTGTFGRARCTIGTTFTHVGSTPPPVEGPVTDEGTQASSSESTEVVSLWFTSDVLARSSALGPGGSVEDLELAFRRANVPVTVVQESPDQDSGDKNRKRILTAIRHRRVDSWSPRDNAPRATRLAIQAGSVVQVRISPQDLGALEALGHIGVGELTPQGYGRFLVDSPMLAEAMLPLFKTKNKSFTAPTEAVS